MLVIFGVKLLLSFSVFELKFLICRNVQGFTLQHLSEKNFWFNFSSLDGTNNQNILVRPPSELLLEPTQIISI